MFGLNLVRVCKLNFIKYVEGGQAAKSSLLDIPERIVGMVIVDTQAGPLRHNLLVAPIDRASRMHGITCVHITRSRIDVAEEDSVAGLGRNVDTRILEVCVASVFCSLARIKRNMLVKTFSLNLGAHSSVTPFSKSLPLTST